MAPLVKCLMYKREKQSLIPRTHVESCTLQCTSVISALEEEIGEPLGLPGLTMSSILNERPFSKHEMMSN